jgi:C1A family cysteine protease
MPIILDKERVMKGWKPSPPDPRDVKFSSPIHMRFLMPSLLDLSKHVTPVESQIDNDCTAHAGTSGYESTMKKAGKDPLDMARRFLYWVTRVLVEKQAPTADEGAFLRSVMKAMKLYGIPYETDWPYSTPLEKEPTQAVKDQAAKHQVLAYYSCPSVASIRYALYKGLFVVGGFMVPTTIGDNDTTKTGIVKMPKLGSGWDGGHAVLFCGDDTRMKANGQTGYLKFANSWGTDWGNKGFGYLPHAYVEKGYALDFWAIQAIEG